MSGSKRNATIELVPSCDNRHYYVRTDDGELLLLAGLGAPKAGKIGDKGTVEYRTSGHYGLFFWQPENRANLSTGEDT